MLLAAKLLKAFGQCCEIGTQSFGQAHCFSIHDVENEQLSLERETLRRAYEGFCILQRVALIPTQMRRTGNMNLFLFQLHFLTKTMHLLRVLR